MRRVLHIGFTGTSKGMSEHQFRRLTQFMLSISRTHSSASLVLHHGDCIGADAVAHEIAVGFGWDVVKHPSTIAGKRAYCKGGITWPAKPPLQRNKEIVEVSSILIACPYQRNEVLRSGTWATIRYAKARNRRVVHIFREGREV